MHPHNFHASGSSGRGTAFVLGEYGVAKLFLRLLTHSDMCAGLHECVPVRCISLAPWPFWLMHDTTLLASKSEHADTFVGPLEPSLPRPCLQTLSVLG